MVAVVVIVTRPNTSTPTDVLPTLAVLPSLIPTTQLATAATPVKTADLVSSPEPTAPLAPVRLAETATLPLSATPPNPVLSPSEPVPTTTPALAVVTNIPGTTAQPTSGTSPTPAPNTPTITPAQQLPTVAPPANAVAINAAVDVVGNGQLRVVAVTRPAEALIQELGGSVPKAPAEQAWVMVELLLVCSIARNCAPTSATMSLVGSSGHTYTPSPDFYVEPLFGSTAYSLNQVWGYLGFVVPTSEERLYLLLSQNGQTYAFALQ